MNDGRDEGPLGEATCVAIGAEAAGGSVGPTTRPVGGMQPVASMIVTATIASRPDAGLIAGRTPFFLSYRQGMTLGHVDTAAARGIRRIRGGDEPR